MNKPLRLIELFAGYGSQALALKYLGVDFCHWYVCEFNKTAINSYNEIHQTSFTASNIKDVKASDLNIANTDKYNYLMTYSFPCTDISSAGNMRGMLENSNTSSSLLWEVKRLLEECSELPQYLVMENVPQIENRLNKSEFKRWIQFLSNLGYRSYYKVLNSKDFGIPQSRNRSFLVSILNTVPIYYKFPKPNDEFKVISDILCDDVPVKYWVNAENFTTFKSFDEPFKPQPIGRYNQILGCTKLNCTCHIFGCRSRIIYDNGVCSTLTAKNCCSKGSVQQLKLIYISKYNKIRGLTPIEHFRLMGVKDEDFNKLSCSDNQKYKLAGNSIVVNVLMAIFYNLFIEPNYKKYTLI